MATVNWSLQAYTDTAANLNARATPILEGQLAIETDTITTTPKFKIGDGVSLYSALPYFYGGASSAQNLNNVLGVGSSTSGQDMTITADDQIKMGAGNAVIFNDSTETDSNHIFLATNSAISGYSHIFLKDGGNEFHDESANAYISLQAGSPPSCSISFDHTNNGKIDIFNGTGGLNLNGATYFPNLTASTVPYLDANNKVTSSAVTPTELGLLSGLTGFTGSGTLLAKGTSPTFTTDITTPKVLTNGVQVVYLPNQANYVGSLFIGNGGASIDNTGVDAGDYNTYIGIGSGFATTIAKRNTALGYNTLGAVTSGWANTAIGYNTLSTGIGTGSLTISGAGNEFYANTGVGEGVMSLATTASYNTGIGVNSLNALTTGIMNTGVGVHALQSVQTGSYNSALGKESLYNYTDSYSVAIGHTAGWNKVSGSMLAIGYQAGYSDVSTGANTFIGNQAGYYQKNGYYMTIVGYQAAFASANKSGYYHTIMGYRAGYQLGNCEGNTLIGYQSGYSKTTGDYNTFIGHDAGNNASQLATAGNSTAIGYGAYTTASNQIVFGNANVTQHIFRAGSVLFYQGADVASANNLVVSNGNVFEITGTTQINLISNLTWQNGSQITLLFASTPTVKHNQATSTTNITIQLAGAVDFAATAGDTLTLVLSEIGGTQAWREVSRAVI